MFSVCCYGLKCNSESNFQRRFQLCVNQNVYAYAIKKNENQLLKPKIL